MRTTIDLPGPVHEAVRRQARARGQTLSQTVTDLVEQAMRGRDLEVHTSELTGLPVVRLGRRLGSDDVATLLDEP